MPADPITTAATSAKLKGANPFKPGATRQYARDGAILLGRSLANVFVARYDRHEVRMKFNDRVMLSFFQLVGAAILLAAALLTLLTIALPVAVVHRLRHVPAAPTTPTPAPTLHDGMTPF